MILVGCNIRDSKEVLNINSYDEFIEALKSKDYQVDEEVLQKEDTIIIRLFSEYPRYIHVDNNIIIVYEFPDTETAKSQADTISQDGYTISTYDKKKPFFYQKGRLIVQHRDINLKLFADLKETLGEPIQGFIKIDSSIRYNALEMYDKLQDLRLQNTFEDSK